MSKIKPYAESEIGKLVCPICKKVVKIIHRHGNNLRQNHKTEDCYWLKPKDLKELI